MWNFSDKKDLMLPDTLTVRILPFTINILISKKCLGYDQGLNGGGDFGSSVTYVLAPKVPKDLYSFNRNIIPFKECLTINAYKSVVVCFWGIPHFFSFR